MSHTGHLVARIATAVADSTGGRLPVTDGPPGTPPTGPHVIVYGGTDTPTTLALTHEHLTISPRWQAVCVSNTAESARLTAALVTATIDNTTGPQPYSLYEVTYTSDPIEDHDDPSAWRWSCTVEIALDAPNQT